MLMVKITDSSRLPLKKRMMTTSGTKRPFRPILNAEPKSIVTVNPSANKKARISRRSELATPTNFVHLVLKKQNIDIEEVATEANKKFVPPTKEQLQAYQKASTALRDSDLKQLKKLHKSGMSLDCCNKFGDSLISIACRRGMTDIVKYLVEDAKVSLFVRDDFLRTPLHDACWTAEPNFEIVEMLLKVAPELVVLRDSRGATPFDYIRANHSKPWVEFLARRRALLIPRE